MGNKQDELSRIKNRLILLAVTLAGMVALAGLGSRGSANEATSVAAPRVAAVTQVTHDGYRKSGLLADESQLFITELPESTRLIAKVVLPSSHRTIVPSPFSSLQALDLSPDHQKLLVSAREGRDDDELWTLPVSAGAPERVGSLNGRDASWSADGKNLVFASGHWLRLATAAGSEERELYKASGPVFAPRFSPDGQKIRFTVSNPEQNTTSLWEVGREGSGAHALFPDWPLQSTACCGNWTGDGKYFIFQASQTVPNTSLIVNSLWALTEEKGAEFATSPVPLTSGPMSFGNPWLAKDGQRMWAIGVQPSVEVVKFNPHKKKLEPVVAGLSATDVEYSADGKWIAYVSVPEGTLWRARANGKDRIQLTTAPDRAALPRWSPDGKQIAYASMKPGSSWKLAIVPASGGESREMFPESGSQIDANWSADGSRLMFGDYSKDTSGLSIRLLDFKTRKIETIAGSQGLFSPRWSPDGNYIAAISPDNTTLMRFDFRTQKWSVWLKETAGTVSYPVWSADSQSLYFDDLVNGAEAIRRVKVDGNEPELVFELPTIERYLGALGPWSGRAVDGEWMFVQDRSTQEVYQLSLELP